jgi:hypothetical protein
MTRMELPTRPASRHPEQPDARTIWRGATVVASVLIAAGIGLGIANLLSFSALALLGGLSAGIAAVKERPRRAFGWILVVLAGIGLVAVSIAGMLARP